MALLGIYGVATRNRADLRSGEAIAAWLRELCESIGMTPVGDPIIERFDHWEGGAPSGVLFLDDGVTVTQTLGESAAICHTYPEDDMVEVMLDSCNDIPNAAEVATAIRDRWCLLVPPGGVVWLPDWGWKRLRERRGYMVDNWPNMLSAFVPAAPTLRRAARFVGR